MEVQREVGGSFVRSSYLDLSSGHLLTYRAVSSSSKGRIVRRAGFDAYERNEGCEPTFLLSDVTEVYRCQRSWAPWKRRRKRARREGGEEEASSKKRGGPELRSDELKQTA